LIIVILLCHYSDDLAAERERRAEEKNKRERIK
jgi:hypothetical protein